MSIKSIWHIITTLVSMREYPTNKLFDDAMLLALDSPIFTITDHQLNRLREGRLLRTIMLNGREIWISNYPYAYGGDYGNSNMGLPSHTTVLKLRRMVDDTIKQIKINNDIDDTTINIFIENW